jgi:quercetin dioxygenase-like cupin family protein
MNVGGGYVLPSREGHQIALVGLGITVKANGKSTSDAYSMFELAVPPRTDGPPAHIHTLEDESFVCLAGKLDVRLGDQDFTLGPGDYLYMPRDIVHTFRNTYDEESRVISVVSPAGLEGYYQALADVPPGSKGIGKIREINKVKQIMADFGIVLEFPPEVAVA